MPENFQKLNTLSHPPIAPKSSSRLSDIREKFLERCRNKQRSTQTYLTYQRDLAQFQAYCLQRGIVRLDHVTTDVLEEYAKLLSNKGFKIPGRVERQGGRKLGPNAPATVFSKLKIIRMLIKYALKRQVISKDPAPGYELPAKPKRREHCWTMDEALQIIAHADPETKDIFRFLMRTGLRANEFCWLRKEDVDLQAGTLQIRKKTCPITGKPWQPKHGRERIVPLTADALTIAKEAAKAGDSQWLFPSPDPNPGRWRLDRLLARLKKAMKAAGISRGVLHTFRHLFCSFLASHAKQISPFEVMKMLGHSSLDIVLTYYHVNEAEMCRSMKQIQFPEPTPKK